MDYRGRGGQVGAKRGGKTALPPIGGRRISQGPVHGQARDVHRIGGGTVTRHGDIEMDTMPDMIRLEHPAPPSHTVVDTSILVGPMYDDTESRRKAIKEELGDITSRLRRTLTEMDELYDDEDPNDPEVMVNNIRKRVQALESTEMKEELNTFIDHYKDIQTSYDETDKEREDLLFSLADWFTIDHMDDAGHTSMNDREAAVLGENYNDTVAAFEKMKALQDRINKSPNKGVAKQLQMEKRKLESDVVATFNNLKDNAVQNAGAAGMDEDFAPWKTMADEIVGLLHNVRMEKEEEFNALKAKTADIIKELERQQHTVKSLKRELKDKKKLVTKFADENGDLQMDLAELKCRLEKYDRELENAQKLLQKHFAAELLKKDGVENAIVPAMHRTDMTEMQKLIAPLDDKMKASISDMMKQLSDDQPGLARISSDPAILRTQLRSKDEVISNLAEEIARLEARIEELEEDVTVKDDKIWSLEKLNAELTGFKQHVSLLNLPLAADGTLASDEADTIHIGPADRLICEKCQGQIGDGQSSREDVKKLSQEKAEKPGAEGDEVQRLAKKNKTLKKALADIEMKLSNAYREISELRQLTMSSPISLPTPEPVIIYSSEESSEDMTTAKKDQIKETKDTAKPGQKKRRRGGPLRKEAEQEDEVELEKERQKLRERRKPRLPPAGTHIAKKPVNRAGKTRRENALYTVGDLQARLNLLVNGVMNFVGEVAKEVLDDIPRCKYTITEFGTEDAQSIKVAKEKANQKELANAKLKSSIMLLGQRAVELLREAYNMMPNKLNLQHEEYELIYRAFKEQQRQYMTISKNMETATDIAAAAAEGAIGPEAAYEYYIKSMNFGAGKLPGKDSLMSKGGTWPIDERLGLPGTSLSASSMHSHALSEMVLVKGMTQSHSDIEMKATESKMSYQSMTQLNKDFTIMSETPVSAVPTDSILPNREEVKMHRATVPKKGMIKLTSLEAEAQNPLMFEKKPGDMGEEMVEKPRPKHRPTPMNRKKMLIKRRDILDQVVHESKLQEVERQYSDFYDDEAGTPFDDNMDVSLAELEMNLASVAGQIVQNRRKSTYVNVFANTLLNATNSPVDEAIARMEDGPAEPEAIERVQSSAKSPVKYSRSSKAKPEKPKAERPAPAQPKVVEQIRTTTFNLPSIKKGQAKTGKS